jgi:hypothetical protein
MPSSRCTLFMAFDGRGFADRARTGLLRRPRAVRIEKAAWAARVGLETEAYATRLLDQIEQSADVIRETKSQP